MCELQLNCGDCLDYSDAQCYYCGSIDPPCREFDSYSQVTEGDFPCPDLKFNLWSCSINMLASVILIVVFGFLAVLCACACCCVCCCCVVFGRGRVKYRRIRE